MAERIKLMLDTNVFDDVLDGHLDLALWSKRFELVATDIQMRELQNTPNELRRDKLMMVFNEAVETRTHQTTDLRSMDGFGWICVGESNFFDQIIRLMRGNSFNDGRDHIPDAIIAETALLRGCKLVTNDTRLKKAANAICAHTAFATSELETLF
jgi:predicted nucleic acid-binding protein